MGRSIDVCNGDADGLCALVQYRLARPAEATLVTGLKRDIVLLERVQVAAGDEVAVFDISMARNRTALERLLAEGAHVRYFDHHDAGTPLVHARLESHLNDAATVCTGMLVDVWLGGRYRPWAVVAAFGDGLAGVARSLGRSVGLDERELDALQDLGEAINHNAYGESVADQLYSSAELYELIRPYADPRDLLLDEGAVMSALCTRRAADLQAAVDQAPVVDSAQVLVFRLPAAAWSRRVTGSLAHDLAAAHPTRRIAVAVEDGRGRLRVSVRLGAQDKQRADAICRDFEGNGRARAAGIDALPESRWSEFIDRLGAG